MAEQSPKGARVNHVPTLNPAHSVPTAPSGDQAARDNRSRQLNPNNDVYWQSRGQHGRPAMGRKQGAQ